MDNGFRDNPVLTEYMITANINNNDVRAVLFDYTSRVVRFYMKNGDIKEINGTESQNLPA